MNWEAIGAVSESLGAVAVLATLIYLTIQVRQTGASTRTQSYHQAIEQLVNGALHPNFFALLTKAEAEELSPEEELDLAVPLNCFLFGHEILYHLWSKGQIDDELWENIFLNNLVSLKMKKAMEVLASRPAPLSRKLERLITETVV